MLLLLNIVCFSQENEVDSILKLYQKSKNDTSRIDLLLKITDGLADRNPEKAINYARTELKVAQAINDHYREVLLDLMLAESYGRLGKIAESLDCLDKGYRIAAKNNFTAQLGSIQLNIGVAYADVGNEKLAIEYYMSGVHYFKILNDNIGLIQSYVDLSDAYYHINKPDSAIYYIELAKPLSFKMNNYQLSYIYNNAAEAYYEKKEYATAEDYANKSFAIAQMQNNLYVLSDNYLVLAKINFDKGNINNAKTLINKGLEIAKQSSIRENLIDDYDLMSKVLEKQNKPTEALKFNKLYITVKDSVLSTINSNISQAYEYEKQDEKMAELRTEKLQQNTELKRQSIITTVIFVTLLLVILISGYIYYSRFKLSKANNEIKRAYQEVSNHQNEIIQQNKELIKYNEQIRKQSEDIERLGNIKDRLFNIISHDLRSPLGTLTGMLSLLKNGTITPDKFQKFVPELINGVNTTTELVDNLLHWSNSQLKGATINPTEFDITPLVQNQVQLFERQASDKELQLLNEIHHSLFVFADKNMIDLVLRNLVANAIKFCSKDCKIIITGRQLTDRIEISVIDDGKGIEAENIEKIFQSKERYSTLGTNREKGTGLGLMLCKDFVEKNNGQIGVESEVNVGSKFWFTLPLGIDNI